MKVLLRTRQVLMVMLVVLVSLLGLVREGMGVAYAASTITVTNCPTEAMLMTDITSAGAGGTVLFTIPSPCTIAITSTLTISQDLTLDNQGQSVTLDGQNSMPVLVVSGGIAFTLNTLTIANGFSGPSTSSDAAGITSEGSNTVNINDSTFTNNHNSNFFGGGIVSLLGGTTNISNSTFDHNSAGNGGGINNNGGGTANITNTTITNNSAISPGNAGGGIINFGTMSISNSTIASNGIGGGIFNDGTMSITQSIVANNAGGDCSVLIPLTDGGYNLDSDGTCGFTTANHDLPKTNPQLDPAGLANNGGPTQTIALLPGSPANDKIPASLCPTTDQRGFPRPDNGESVCDIGAYEFQDPPTPPSPSTPACQISTTKPGTFCLNQNGNFTTTDIS